MDENGLLLCSRYAVAPNFFGYCGPDENASLVDHLNEKVADTEVSAILSQFETLFPYLKLISKENNIPDLFNEKVVEAYWIGNKLLDSISNRNYSYLLTEKLDLEKKMGTAKFQKVRSKVLTSKFYPHHAFHVFNIFKRTGHVNSNHTINTMNSCRIGWGKISIKPQHLKVNVETKELTINGQQLSLGKPTIKELKIDYKSKSFIKNLNIGDWVSFHWGFVCDVLSKHQVSNLVNYTQRAINYYNSP